MRKEFKFHPATSENDLTDEEASFGKAMEAYMRDNRRPFPTWTEVLAVAHALGYRRVAPETERPRFREPRSRRRKKR